LWAHVTASSASSPRARRGGGAEQSELHALFPLGGVEAEPLARALIAAVKGHEKLRSASARALGFIAAWLLSELVGWSPSAGIAPFDALFEGVIECLCSLAAGGVAGGVAAEAPSAKQPPKKQKLSALHPKIRWSASYALGVLLRSAGATTGSSRRSPHAAHGAIVRWHAHLTSVVDVLCGAVSSSANFKVRIAAAKAMAHAAGAERVVRDAVVPLGEVTVAASGEGCAVGPSGARTLTLLLKSIAEIDDDANTSFSQFQYRDRFEEALWGAVACSLRGFAAGAAAAAAEEDAAVAAAGAGEDIDLARVRAKAATLRATPAALAAIAAPASRAFFASVIPSAALPAFCEKCERALDGGGEPSVGADGGEASITRDDVSFLRFLAEAL
jgi:hypothetical protein